MEYRKLPHGKHGEMISTIGIGTSSLPESSIEEIEATYRLAFDKGVNFVDLAGGNVKIFEPLGRAMEGRREKVYIQLHFGAVYQNKGDYGWSRDLNVVKKAIEDELRWLKTDYIDFGFLHCTDDLEDYEELVNGGILDYMKELKQQGKIHYLGFSSHTPEVASRILDLGCIDIMMFSINAAYDFEYQDELGKGSYQERKALFEKAGSLGVGISVMKPFGGGKLLSEERSPFKKALTRHQCIKYVLDRPGVLVALPGIRNREDLLDVLGYYDASEEELDYSFISGFTPSSSMGSCTYCNHCKPCPVGIDIGLVNKYYDLALVGDQLAVGHYKKLPLNAKDCIGCGHCDSRCPFKVHQSKRMQEIAAYFEGK